MRKLTTEIFIQRAIKIHGNTYDYSKVNYINSKISVIIICPIHGEFSIIPNNHLSSKRGCQECSFEIKKFNLSKTQEQFIQDAIEIHGLKYDYSKVKYNGAFTKVIIICPIHGSFIITPHNHLHKRGCKECGLTRRNKSFCKTIDQFIKESIQVHGLINDYSKVIYINSKTKVEIICKKHNKSFWQFPNNHLAGNGCPICKSSKGELSIRKCLDNFKIEYIPEKYFPKCESQYPLFFDFYLPNHNICIEYDGIQHFEPIEYWGGVKAYKSNINRDKIKNKYCYENGIKLIRIPYWEKDNIEYYLSKVT